MSMASFYKAISPQDLTEVLNGKVDFDEVGENIDLDYYSMEMLDYLPESDSPLFALLTQSKDHNQLAEIVDFARLMDENSINKVVEAFYETNLKEFANDMGYPEEENAEVSNSLYKTLVNLQNFFENAKANHKLVINWVM
nr:hypothetical protein [Moraxella osloensis]